MEARHPEHDLDFGASLGRLEAAGVLAPADAGSLRALARNEGRVRWDQLAALLDPADARVPVWDFLSVAAVLVPLERPGVRPAGTPRG
jgi:hypothetical protein